MITLKNMKKNEKKEKKNDLKKGTVNLTKKSLKKEEIGIFLKINYLKVLA